MPRNTFHGAHLLGVWTLATALACPLVAQTLGVNHYGFGDYVPGMLAQLSPSPVPVRMTFYWHKVAGAPDYYDSEVAAATHSGIPLLGILAYSSRAESSMPADFDFTEVSPFRISWHSAKGPLPWGSSGVQGTAKYLWNTSLEDGQTYPRVVCVRPTTQGLFVHGEIDFQVPAGHSVVLWAKAGFRQNANSRARANFSITYLNGADFLSLANKEKRYDGLLATLHADLSRLGGRTVKLFFNVDSVAGYSPEGAVWQAAGVLVDGIPLSMSQVAAGDLQSVINYPPQSPDAFADFAAGLARRYPQIQAWEIWNEPNTSFFWRPAVNAQAYVALLRKTHRALKAVNPKAKVILGGLSPGSPDAPSASVFLSDIYQAGGAELFDAVAYHAYGEGPLQNWLPDALLQIRYVMAANGDLAKPVWITEMGCYTHGLGSVSESWQAAYLREARSLLASISFIERVYWYTLRDANQSSDPEKNYGLFHADGSPKPAVRAFSN